jgi:hypothetical protein
MWGTVSYNEGGEEMAQHGRAYLFIYLFISPEENLLGSHKEEDKKKKKKPQQQPCPFLEVTCSLPTVSCLRL